MRNLGKSPHRERDNLKDNNLRQEGLLSKENNPIRDKLPNSQPEIKLLNSRPGEITGKTTHKMVAVKRRNKSSTFPITTGKVLFFNLPW